MTKSTLADVENEVGPRMVLMDPVMGHKAAAAELALFAISVSESSVRRWRKAHDYKVAVPTPTTLNTQPAEGSTDSTSDGVLEYHETFHGEPCISLKDIVNVLLEAGDLLFAEGEVLSGECFHAVAESFARPFMEAAVLATADADG